jgi:hypothetical protein
MAMLADYNDAIVAIADNRVPGHDSNPGDDVHEDKTYREDNCCLAGHTLDLGGDCI